MYKSREYVSGICVYRRFAAFTIRRKLIMEMNNKPDSGIQKISADDLEQVTGGETRFVSQKTVCPICGEEITVSLEVHMRGHRLAPCPKCGEMMPAGPRAVCFHCGYDRSTDSTLVQGDGAIKPTEPIVFPGSKS